VVRAVPRADAAVVDHVVQAFARVHGRANRAHLLAGRVLALLAGDGLEARLGGVRLALVVAIDAQPEHLPARCDGLLARDGDVVLRLARRDASAAADALVQIDAHAPAMAVVGHR